jgi:hypothetical protein
MYVKDVQLLRCNLGIRCMAQCPQGIQRSITRNPIFHSGTPDLESIGPTVFAFAWNIDDHCNMFILDAVKILSVCLESSNRQSLTPALCKASLVPRLHRIVSQILHFNCKFDKPLSDLRCYQNPTALWKRHSQR